MRKSLISFILAGLLALLCFGPAQAGTLALEEVQSSPEANTLDDLFAKEVPDFLGSIRTDEVSFEAHMVIQGHDGSNDVATDAKEVPGNSRGIEPTSINTVHEVNLTQAPHLRL